ncbi:permease [Myroides sp. LJL116]
MNTMLKTIEYFILISVELLVLFLIISMIVELLLMYIPAEKLQKKLSGKGIKGNIIGAFFGSITPFCACSTIPMTLGFLNARVPFGSTMSFLIASPLLNPIIIGMLGVMVGIKAALLYFIVAFTCAVLFGYVLEKSGGIKYLKNVSFKDKENNFSQEQLLKELSFWQKVKLSFLNSWNGMKPILIYLFIGVGIGALIYGYLPESFIMSVAGPDTYLSIPIAALVGVPLYIRAETAIPIGMALMDKGMSLGTVVALIIGGAGMAIPEMSMLAAIFKRKMVVMIVTVIFLTAIISGYVFNLLI